MVADRIGTYMLLIIHNKH